MRTFIASFLLSFAIPAFAQSPTPMVVQAANAPAAPATTSTPVANQIPNALQPTIQMLEKMKAANEDTLKRQEAALQQLDEIEKAADQIRIFSHRSGG